MRRFIRESHWSIARLDEMKDNMETTIGEWEDEWGRSIILCDMLRTLLTQVDEIESTAKYLHSI